MSIKLDVFASQSLPENLANLISDFCTIKDAQSNNTCGPKVYICSDQDVVDANLIKRLPSTVGLIVNTTSTNDLIDLDEAKKRGIKVSFVPDSATDVAANIKANIFAFIDRGFPLNNAI